MHHAISAAYDHCGVFDKGKLRLYPVNFLNLGALGLVRVDAVRGKAKDLAGQRFKLSATPFQSCKFR